MRTKKIHWWLKIIKSNQSMQYWENRMSQTSVICQKHILGLNLGLNEPKFRAWNYDKNKKYQLVVEDYLK